MSFKESRIISKIVIETVDVLKGNKPEIVLSIEGSLNVEK